MAVTTTEVQNNFGRYLRLAKKNDITITKNGRRVARLVSYQDEKSCMIREDSSKYNYDGIELTYEEFLKFSGQNENRYEFIDGRIYSLNSPLYSHQKVVREILGEFIIWFRHSDYEPLFSPFNVTLYNGDDTINVVQPDILIISDKEEIDSDMDRYNGIPILVVEVISESTRKRDFVKKLDLYMSSGIREYWLVNPFSEEIVVYIFKNKDIINMFTFKENEIVKSGVFDGLSVSLKDVFR